MIRNTTLYAIGKTILQRLYTIYFPQLNLQLSFATHNTPLYAIDKNNTATTSVIYVVFFFLIFFFFFTIVSFDIKNSVICNSTNNVM